ncbi:uncharacterized protein PV07_09632 [Cladophialophora immunda]|uniref:Uncharacterized protein n=1 Tax=Cladophialophora immunda TaxID=569365 RepID=A0A0D2C7W3_9EURO|nr:uncharacterized protein PV07_09632 [Cladophialophora immunda]KIW26545.1 hypothetical protein PV07_09632 [Cladophialophora immunda]
MKRKQRDMHKSSRWLHYVTPGKRVFEVMEYHTRPDCLSLECLSYFPETDISYHLLYVSYPCTRTNQLVSDIPCPRSRCPFPLATAGEHPLRSNSLRPLSAILPYNHLLQNFSIAFQSVATPSPLPSTRAHHPHIAARRSP